MFWLIWRILASNWIPRKLTQQSFWNQTRQNQTNQWKEFVFLFCFFLKIIIITCSLHVFLAELLFWSHSPWLNVGWNMKMLSSSFDSKLNILARMKVMFCLKSRYNFRRPFLLMVSDLNRRLIGRTSNTDIWIIKNICLFFQQTHKCC